MFQRVRPRRVRQNGRTSLYVLTAVCATVGAAAGLIAPWLAAWGPSQMRWPSTYLARSWTSSFNIGLASAMAGIAAISRLV